MSNIPNTEGRKPRLSSTRSDVNTPVIASVTGTHYDRHFVKGKQLFAFDPDLSQTLRDDIMDCLLYAQLSSDERFDRRRDWVRWMALYQSTLEAAGVQVAGQIKPVRFAMDRLSSVSNLSSRMDRLASNPRLQSMFRESVDRLVSSEHAQGFFNLKTFALRASSASFQVVPCLSRRENEAELLLCGLKLTVQGLVPRWPAILSLLGSMTVDARGASLLLNEQGYAPHRTYIRNYLAQRARERLIKL